MKLIKTALLKHLQNIISDLDSVDSDLQRINDGKYLESLGILSDLEKAVDLIYNASNLINNAIETLEDNKE